MGLGVTGKALVGIGWKCPGFFFRAKTPNCPLGMAPRKISLAQCCSDVLRDDRVTVPRETP
jgi:hypothetical protein